MSSIPVDAGSVAWLPPAHERVWHDFMLMTAQLIAVMNRDLQANFGLSAADYGVLVALSERAPNSARIFELSSELGWEKSRLSHHLARMVQRHLVEKTLCPQDARGALISLTDAGWQALRSAAPRHVTTVRDYFIDLLDERQLGVLDEIVTTVLARLQSAPSES